jgi:hypothetical protein
MPAIFISYRRDDAEGEAGRLFHDLTAQFGADSIFMDVMDIKPGRDFRKVIDENVSSCGVLLAMIGKGWINVRDDKGRRRLDDPQDFVRLEIASALKRDIPVIPVLVHGASMPRAEQLPEELKELAYRSAVELTHARWESDVQVLIKALSGDVGGLPRGPSDMKAGLSAASSLGKAGVSTTGPAASTQPVRESRSAIFAALMVAMLVTVAIAAAYILLSSRNGRKPSAVERASSPAQAAGYPRSLPAGAEIKAGVGTHWEVVYRILTAQLDRQAEGELSLRFSIRMTNNHREPCLIGRDQFRLLVDGVPRAPTKARFPNPALDNQAVLVEGYSAQEGDVIFVVPDTAESVEFLVVNQQGLPGETYEVPVNLQTARP